MNGEVSRERRREGLSDPEYDISLGGVNSNWIFESSSELKSENLGVEGIVTWHDLRSNKCNLPRSWKKLSSDNI